MDGPGATPRHSLGDLPGAGRCSSTVRGTRSLLVCSKASVCMGRELLLLPRGVMQRIYQMLDLYWLAARCPKLHQPSLTACLLPLHPCERFG